MTSPENAAKNTEIALENFKKFFDSSGTSPRTTLVVLVLGFLLLYVALWVFLATRSPSCEEFSRTIWVTRLWSTAIGCFSLSAAVAVAVAVHYHALKSILYYYNE